MNGTWQVIHDFFHGWGYHEVIPGNEIVLEEHKGEGYVPWKVVRSKEPEKYLFDRDARRLLKVDIFAKDITQEELYSIYERLQPLLVEEIKNIPPWKPPTSFTIPKVNRIFPHLISLVSDLVNSQPLLYSEITSVS